MYVALPDAMLTNTALSLLLAAAEDLEDTSTVEIAEKAGVSQQSVSRVLTELAEEGLVRKEPLSRGLHISITPKGRMQLINLRARIEQALEEDLQSLTGTVQKGLGEGRYYLSVDGYKESLKELLGDEPYPGTLNVKVDPTQRERFLGSIKETVIKGFETGERSYGPVKFYPCRVGSRECGILIPIRTNHGPDLIEIVDTEHLRSYLHLHDNMQITVQKR